MSETWLPAPGHPNHIVSDAGRLRRKGVNAPILQGYVDQDGYRRVRLDGLQRRVHRLVCEAFHGSPPPGTECAHTDGDPLNNAATNLRWATHAENVADTIAQGRFHYNRAPSGERHHAAKLSDEQITLLRQMAEDGHGQRAIAQALGISQSHVSRVLAGRRRPKGIAPEPRP